MPRWIDHQSTKAERQKAAHASLRRAIESRDWAEATKLEPIRAAPRGIRPGERRIDLTEDQLAEALAKASNIPRMLDYPHLLMLRERGFTRQVWADRGVSGEFDMARYVGDVITEVGERWLRLRE